MDSDSIRTQKTSHSHNIQVTKVYSKGSVKIGIVGAIGNFKKLLSFNEVVRQFKYQSNGVFGLLDTNDSNYFGFDQRLEALTLC